MSEQTTDRWDNMSALVTAEMSRQHGDLSDACVNFMGGFVSDDGLFQVDGTFDMYALAEAIQDYAWRAGRDAASDYVLRQAESLENDAALPPAQRSVRYGASLSKDYRILSSEIKVIQP